MPAGKKYVEAIQSATDRMVVLIGSLHDRAAIEPRTLSLNLRPEPVGALLLDAIAAFRVQIEDQHRVSPLRAVDAQPPTLTDGTHHVVPPL